MSQQRWIRVFATAAGLALLAGLLAWAQVPTTGSVRGYVTDDQGKPVVGAQVIFTGLGRTIKLKTNKNGEYFSLGLQPGKYTITLIINGEEVTKREDVDVAGGVTGDPNSATFANQKGKFDFSMRRAGDDSAREEAVKAKSGYDRAVALNKARQYEEALAELQPLVEKDPSQWVVHWQLSISYDGLNRADEAEASLKKAIELNPSDAKLYNELGQFYLNHKRPEDARKQFETAAAMSPEDAATYWYNMAVTFYNTGDVKSAIEPLRRVVELDPGHANAHFYLGVCLFSTAESKQEGGQLKTVVLPGTREAFEAYLALAPNGPYAAQAKEFLQQLEATVPAAVRPKKQ